MGTSNAVWPLVFTVLAASEGKWRRAGIWGAITAIGSWYYGAYAAVLLTVIIGKEVWRREFSALKGLAWMGGLIAIPALYYADESRKPRTAKSKKTQPKEST